MRVLLSMIGSRGDVESPVRLVVLGIATGFVMPVQVPCRAPWSPVNSGRS